MLNRQQCLFTVTAGENERDVEFNETVGDREAVSIAQIDVKDCDCGLHIAEKIQSTLRSRLRCHVLGAQADQNIFTIERDDETVLDQ